MYSGVLVNGLSFHLLSTRCDSQCRLKWASCWLFANAQWFSVQNFDQLVCAVFYSCRYKNFTAC